MSDSRPPLRARLHWYDLSTSEFALLTAMCEASSDGTMVFASVPRLAAYAKLTRRQVDRLIKGYEDPRTGVRIKGFLERGILTQLAKPGARKRTATYRVNEDALPLDPRMRPYVNEEKQGWLPGIVKPPKSQSTWTRCPPSSDTVTTVTGHGVHSTLDTVSTDSKALYSKPVDSNSEIRQRAMLWTEKNSYAYRAFCRELEAIFGASIGAHNFDHDAAVCRAAQRAGVPDHIALELAREDS